jgi:hypothetical protein
VHVDVSHYGDFTITVYDVIGHLILQKNISSATSFDVPLSGFDFSAGLYLDSHSFVTLKCSKKLYEPIEAATGQKYIDVHPNICATQKK